MNNDSSKRNDWMTCWRSFKVPLAALLLLWSAIAWPASTWPASTLVSEVSMSRNPVLPPRVVSLNQCLDGMLAPLEADGSIALLRAEQHHGRLEQIVRWQPEIVLANNFSNPLLLRALEQAGQHQAFRVETLTEPQSWPQVQRLYRQVAAHLELPLQRFGGDYVAALESLPQLFNGERVLLLQANHYSFARDTLWHDILQGTGARNAAPGQGLVTVLPEQIVRLDPDYLVTIARQDFAMANRNLLHRALQPLLDKPSLAIEPEVFGCMAQQIPAMLDALRTLGGGYAQ